jgi:hypothetical protein
VNLFKVLCDTQDLIQQMATQIATQVHGNTPQPMTVSALAADATAAALSTPSKAVAL